MQLVSDNQNNSLEFKVSAGIQEVLNKLKERLGMPFLDIHIQSLLLLQQERDDILVAAKTNFSKTDGTPLTTWADIEINLWDFVRYLPDSGVMGNYDDDWGMRIYPAYDGAKITFLLGISKLGDNMEQNLFFILNNSVAQGDFEYSAGTPKANAAVVDPFKRYYSEVYVTTTPRPQQSSDKLSRFFLLSEIISYVNSVGIPLNDHVETKRWRMHLEVGYITSGMNNDLHAKYGEAPVHVGFTAVLTVSKDGTKHTTSLEVARPCPPRCGSLVPY